MVIRFVFFVFQLLPALILLDASSFHVGAAEVKSPNILFIMCDDLNDWGLHPKDHPLCKTPNMDRLRKMSVNFTNAHVPIPVCGPSRKCLFSGLYPHTSQSYGFTHWRGVSGLKGCVPIPLHYRNNGYRVYGTGKLLHSGKGGDFYTEYGIGVDYGPWPWKGVGKVVWTAHPKQYERWKDHFTQHKDFSYGPLSEVPHWLPNETEKVPGAKGWYRSNGKPFRYVNENDRDLMADEVSANWAADVLKRDHEKPFYLAVGFARPHTPLYAPKKYFDLYPIDEVTLPPILEGDLDDCAEALKNRWLWSFQKYDRLMKAGGESAVKEWIQAYLACTSFADAQLGVVLDALEKSPHADNTIVVFTSDHGYHLGEKGNMQKWHLWEEATRVPLFVRVPRLKSGGEDCEHPVSTLDLYPTLIDLCGLPREPNAKGSRLKLGGHSLRPFLENTKNLRWSGPDVAFMSVGKSFDDKEGWGIEPHHSVRSKRYRYTLCSNGEEEFYDHDVDPQEWKNLAGDPNYKELIGEHRKKMEAILKKTSRAATLSNVQKHR